MRILMATGGSGGHIFPALVTARELKQRGHEIIFGGVLKQTFSKIKSEGFECFEISAKGLPTDSPFAVVSFSFATLTSFFESWKILKRVQPDSVVGFGGYGSFPLVFMASLRGIPIMIQEQNVILGKANQVLSFFTKKIAVGFEQAQKHAPPGKVLVTGCPSRLISNFFDRSAILRGFGLPEGVPVILVMGGSQGSRRINMEFIHAAPDLKKKFTFAVIHICGDKDAADCKALYEKVGVPHCVFSFTDEIDKAYRIADLVVSRAGAMTVTELAAFALPAILIPYPFAGGHQRENALVLTQTKASRLIDEKDLTSTLLVKTIFEMLGRKMSKDDIARCYAGIYRSDAVFRLADEIERLKT